MKVSVTNRNLLASAVFIKRDALFKCNDVLVKYLCDSLMEKHVFL